MLFTAKTFFNDMRGKRVDVLGLGVTNTELLLRLAQDGVQVTLRDRRAENQIRPHLLARLRENGVKTRLGETYLDDLDGEVIFRTPGMPFGLEALTAARARGQIVTSELEVFLELCPCPVYGVTGSDGKTTTSSILAEMLRRTGRTVHLGGNIGKPLLPLLDKVSERDLCVVELSSFQLISMRSSPDVAVITNISPNHLDVHRDMEEYVAAKCNVIDHQSAFGRAIISADSPAAAALTGRVRGRLSRFSRFGPVCDGAWMDSGGRVYHSVGGRAVSLFSRDEVLLPGLHNIENLLAATSAAWGVASPKDIAAVARAFRGVEHRIELVRKRNGARWYNDSIATSPSRTIAGLASFDEKMILIAGGYDKNIPFEPMARPVIERVKVLILTGPTADKIEAAVTGHPRYAEGRPVILRAADLAEAVRLADGLAREGDVVSLSPACASFDAFSNFEERGRRFKELVQQL